MTEPRQQQRSTRVGETLRVDPPTIEPWSLWRAFSQTPGVGVMIVDTRGEYHFVNETSQHLFFNQVGTEYRGKTLHDLHPPEFCRERLEMIRRVLQEKKPLTIRHIYYGRRIESTLWPLGDKAPPFDRVFVVSHNQASGPLAPPSSGAYETFETEFIGLGLLNALSQRELEVLVLLGHGMSVPQAASELHRSFNTIQRHKESISRKLHLQGQAEMVDLVVTMGLELSDTARKRYEEGCC